MGAQSNAVPMLRLVNVAADGHPIPSRPGNKPVRHDGPLATTAENHAAAGLSAVDARWVLAVQVARNLEGGKAAALPPDRRRRLIGAAVDMGLRPFDANLVIAIVQDGVRSGEGGLTRVVEDRLVLVPAPRRESPVPTAVFVAATILLALGAFAALVAWLGH